MKKFIDNARHDEPWFVELPIEMKAAFDFLWAKCDAAGVWNGSTRIADIQLGKKVDWSGLEKKSGGRLVRLKTGAFFFPEYVAFQCGVLNEGCPPHRTVIKLLRGHGLLAEGSLTVTLPDSLCGGLPRSPQEQEEEKEGDQDKDKTAELPLEIAPKRKDRGTIHEVIAFCAEIGLPSSDGDATFHKWEGNGWTNDGNPIKDWRATLRNWKTRGFLPSQQGASAAAPRNGLYPGPATGRIIPLDE